MPAGFPPTAGDAVATVEGEPGGDAVGEANLAEFEFGTTDATGWPLRLDDGATTRWPPYDAGTPWSATPTGTSGRSVAEE